ncbi:hypothetical protein F5141DRAFT_553846 [Pisolithus sp. B1]|nr:hypothetical protein F5141DRAFT_553846 [Pisolithus sp. B1]
MCLFMPFSYLIYVLSSQSLCSNPEFKNKRYLASSTLLRKQINDNDDDATYLYAQEISKKDKRKERKEIEKSWDVPTPIIPDHSREIQGKAVVIQSSTCIVPATTGNFERHQPCQCQCRWHVHCVPVRTLHTLHLKHADRLKNLSRKGFVSEVLSLIYTSKQFIDDLW